jgi:uncharacterized UBP type Zn finger protein
MSVRRRLQRLLPWFLKRGRECEHVALIQDVAPSAAGCEECLRLGDNWVHLRLCLICGHVGCCDNSKNKHASRHFQETGHPVIQSFEAGENWRWCYADEVMLPGESTPGNSWESPVS